MFRKSGSSEAVQAFLFPLIAQNLFFDTKQRVKRL